MLLTALSLGTFPDATAAATRVAAFVLALAGLAVGWWRPDLATCALAAAAPLAAGVPRLLGDHGGAPLLPAIAFAFLGSALARRLARGEPSLLPARLLTFATAFLVLAAGSALASSVRGETLYLLLHGRVDPLVVNGLGMTAAARTRDALLVFLGLLLLLLALDAFSRLSLDPGGRDRLLLWTTAGGSAALVFAALQRFLPLETVSPWVQLNRRAGTFTDPNALGVGIGLLVPLLAAALVERGESSDRLRRVIAAVGLIASPVALESSGSRTGLLLLASAAAAASVGLVRRRRVAPPVVAAALLAILAGGLLLARVLPRGGGVAAGGLTQRLGAALSARTLADFTNHRVMFWRAAFEMTAEEPLSGVGLAGFPYEFPAFWQKRHGPVGVTDSATNALLDMASECGLPGLVLALLAVVPLLVRALDAAFARGPVDPASRAAGAGLAGLFVACQTGSHLRFFEIALLASLVAGFLLVPRRSLREDAGAAGGWRPARTAGLLAGAGILAALVATLPTRRPEAPFSTRLWAGVYPGWDGPAGFHWAGPLAYRGVRPGERTVSFRLQNARPDGAPVTVRLDVLEDDRGGGTSVEVPGGGGIRDVALAIPEGGRVVRLRTSPSFVPRELTGRNDRRRLAVRVAGEGL